ncbi:MAG TPA: MarR family transcriptional regulator [Alphaproteobacteria bacterium]|nr:MarR family transcriptional regulator [Alphaproteobacteria bacterium]
MTGTDDTIAPPPDTGADPRFRILNWIGMVDQLATTRANQVLAAGDLPMPQFILLNHFSHRPAEPRTVGGIAAAFQQPQPGITKTVQKLVAKGYLAAEPDAADQRVKQLRLTPAGAAAHRAALDRFAGTLDWLFAGWTEAELAALFGQLHRLKERLDRNR